MSHGLWQGGILAIDTSADVAATAGADGSVVLFDRAAGRVRAHLSAHAKRVTGARPKGSRRVFRVSVRSHLSALARRAIGVAPKTALEGWV